MAQESRLAVTIDSRGAQREAQARQEEQRRAAAQEEVRANAREQEQIADAGAAGQRMRDDAAKLAATVSCPATDTTAIARGQAARRVALGGHCLFRHMESAGLAL